MNGVHMQSETRQPEQNKRSLKALLVTEDASKYMAEVHGFVVTPRTLANHAHAGTGPKFYKTGGRRYYACDHLDEWMLEKLGEPRRSTDRQKKTDP